MRKYKYGLTGEGFSIEEATEYLRGQERLPPQSKEEREAERVMLRQAAARFKAELAELAEMNGVVVTREDLEREMKRQRACKEQEAP